MCASVAEVLDKEFGLTLGSPGVNILDPCTGTGNFIVNILRRIPKKDSPRANREQLFANEAIPHNAPQQPMSNARILTSREYA